MPENKIEITNYDPKRIYETKIYKQLSIVSISPIICPITNHLFGAKNYAQYEQIELKKSRKIYHFSRDVYKVEFSKKGQFCPGDSIAILCPNTDTQVAEMLSILDLSGYETFLIQVKGLVSFSYSGSIKNFFKRHYDFRAMPRRSFLYELMQLSESKNELSYLMSNDGISDYFGLNRNWNTILDILHHFKCTPTLEIILKNTEYLKPRFYSLINNVNLNYEILIGIYMKEINGKIRYGHVSEYIKSAKKDDKLEYYICENRNLRMCQDASKVLMIATGTGIAPFLSYIANKIRNQSWLIYGCRTRHDNLTKYLDVKKKVVFSSENVYVGDFIRKNWDTVDDYIDDSCFVYVCGGTNMQKSIEKLFRELKPKIFNEKRIMFDQWS